MSKLSYPLTFPWQIFGKMIGNLDDLKALRTVMYVRSRLQKMTHGYAIIAISLGDIEAPCIQIALKLQRFALHSYSFS